MQTPHVDSDRYSTQLLKYLATSPVSVPFQAFRAAPKPGEFELAWKARTRARSQQTLQQDGTAPISSLPALLCFTPLLIIHKSSLFCEVVELALSLPTAFIIPRRRSSQGGVRGVRITRRSTRLSPISLCNSRHSAFPQRRREQTDRRTPLHTLPRGLPPTLTSATTFHSLLTTPRLINATLCCPYPLKGKTNVCWDSDKGISSSPRGNFLNINLASTAPPSRTA